MIYLLKKSSKNLILFEKGFLYPDLFISRLMFWNAIMNHLHILAILLLFLTTLSVFFEPFWTHLSFQNNVWRFWKYIVCVIFDPNFYWHITGDLRFRFLSENIVQVLLKLRKRNVENKEVNSFLKEHSLFHALTTYCSHALQSRSKLRATVSLYT